MSVGTSIGEMSPIENLTLDALMEVQEGGEGGSTTLSGLRSVLFGGQNGTYTKTESDARYAPISLFGTVSQYIRQTVNPTSSELLAGHRYHFSVAANQTLPPLSTITNGQNVEVTRFGVGPSRIVTVSTVGDDIIAVSGVGELTSIVIPESTTVVFTRQSSRVWVAAQYDYVTAVDAKFNDRYTKTESDNRFAPISLATTVSQYVNQTVNPSATTLAVGHRYLFTVASSRTLPPLSTLTNGQNLEVTRRVDGVDYPVTISCSGADTIALSGEYAASVTIPHYTTVVFTRTVNSVGVAIWIVTGYNYAVSVESKFNDRYTKAESNARFAPIGLVSTVTNMTDVQNNGSYVINPATMVSCRCANIPGRTTRTLVIAATLPPSSYTTVLLQLVGNQETIYPPNMIWFDAGATTTPPTLTTGTTYIELRFVNGIILASVIGTSA